MNTLPSSHQYKSESNSLYITQEAELFFTEMCHSNQIGPGCWKVFWAVFHVALRKQDKAAFAKLPLAFK